jgi:hypothetical protein
MNLPLQQPDRLILVDAKIAHICEHPATSDWLKASLKSALQRDPVDAVDDAHALLALLEERAGAILD